LQRNFFAETLHMTTKRTGDPWIPADKYGRSLPAFTVNLLVRDIARSLPFYTQVLGATVHYSDPDFVALKAGGVEFMLHADHTYDHHPWHAALLGPAPRGLGAELRLFHLDADEVEAGARAIGASILKPAADSPHGWREVIVADPDGYAWAVGTSI
jgi:catechol 2,3-dioxygenase-like lactoylglutathione lyase family enzyme